MDPTRKRLQRPGAASTRKTWYFAYGSNLHLGQMAMRCPHSRFIGRATMKNYRWQINQRGYANIVPSRDDWVEGLVFELDGDDEERLDRNEGVSKQCYRKQLHTMEVHPGPKVLYRRPVAWIVERGGPARVLADYDGGREHRGRIHEEVLVYISPDYVQDGKPKEEYIGRINTGVNDAAILGVSEDYVNQFIRQRIPKPSFGTRGPPPAAMLNSRQPQPMRRLSMDGPGPQRDWGEPERRNTAVGAGPDYEEPRGRRLKPTLRGNGSRDPSLPKRPTRSSSLRGTHYTDPLSRVVDVVFDARSRNKNGSSGIVGRFFGTSL